MPRMPLLSRAVATAALLLAILIPIVAIKDKIRERENRANEVTAAFAQETSGPQAIVGPMLYLACEETWTEDRVVDLGNGRTRTATEPRAAACAPGIFAPRELRAKASLPTERRRRGLYAIRAFRAEAELSATFDWPEAPVSLDKHERRWKEAYVVMSVGDPRGVQSVSSSAGSTFLDGRGDPALERFSIRQSLGPWSARKASEMFGYQARLSLVGTTSFTVAPVGDRTELSMRSNWPHPSFSRDWSPLSRDVSGEGFTAKWEVASVATGGGTRWMQAAADGKPFGAPGAGVTFFEPVNVYSLSYRATEYAFLFVLFTFAALGLAEVVAGVRMHVVQYGLVACAVAVFFLLLIAFSEHLRFGLAYGIATAACVALMTFYLRHPLGTLARTATFLGFFAAIYGCLYVLLLSEDHALLLGSILVFVVLATAMTLTRRVDWHAAYAATAS